MTKTSLLRYFKTISKAAKALGVSRQAVYIWPEVIPKRRAYDAEELTQGALKVDHSLYGDIGQKPPPRRRRARGS